MQTRIRDATLADLERIVEIYNSTVPSRMVTADTEPVSVESRWPWFEAHRGNRPLWIAEREGAVAGWLSFSSFYGRPAYERTAELSVYVAAEYRQKGIATLLLEKAIADGPAIGVDTLLGFIFAHNRPSLNLFEKLGFARWGFLPKIAVLDGIERNLVILGKRLADQ